MRPQTTINGGIRMVPRKRKREKRGGEGGGGGGGGTEEEEEEEEKKKKKKKKKKKQKPEERTVSKKGKKSEKADLEGVEPSERGWKVIIHLQRLRRTHRAIGPAGYRSHYRDIGSARSACI